MVNCEVGSSCPQLYEFLSELKTITIVKTVTAGLLVTFLFGQHAERARLI